MRKLHIHGGHRAERRSASKQKSGVRPCWSRHSSMVGAASRMAFVPARPFLRLRGPSPVFLRSASLVGRAPRAYQRSTASHAVVVASSSDRRCSRVSAPTSAAVATPVCSISGRTVLTIPARIAAPLGLADRDAAARRSSREAAAPRPEALLIVAGRARDQCPCGSEHLAKPRQRLRDERRRRQRAGAVKIESRSAQRPRERAARQPASSTPLRDRARTSRPAVQ